MFNTQLKKISPPKYLLLFIFSSLLLGSCTQIDLYEKSVAVPGHSWSSSFKPTFTFAIKDTASSYQPFLVLRHTDKYNFKNIYINLRVISPTGDTINKSQAPIDLPLADDENGWMGEGMDDIYEHRIKLTPAAIVLKQKGNYSFIVSQAMREDPLGHVLDIGIRIEKK